MIDFRILNSSNLKNYFSISKFLELWFFEKRISYVLRFNCSCLNAWTITSSRQNKGG